MKYGRFAILCAGLGLAAGTAFVYSMSRKARIENENVSNKIQIPVLENWDPIYEV